MAVQCVDVRHVFFLSISIIFSTHFPPSPPLSAQERVMEFPVKERLLVAVQCGTLSVRMFEIFSLSVHFYSTPPLLPTTLSPRTSCGVPLEEAAGSGGAVCRCASSHPRKELRTQRLQGVQRAAERGEEWLTHTHTHARARARTHMHAHTHAALTHARTHAHTRLTAVPVTHGAHSHPIRETPRGSKKISQ